MVRAADRDSAAGARVDLGQIPREAGWVLDGRVSTREKLNLSPQARAFIDVLRGAVLAACRSDAGLPGAGTTRAAIAAVIGDSPRTLEKWLSPGDCLVPRFDAVLRLLAPDGPLPAPQRERVLAWLDREMGRTSVAITAADPDESPVAAQVVQVFAAGGKVAELVEAMTARDSDGGEAISPTEARLLLPHAEASAREAAELVATLERLAGGRP